MPLDESIVGVASASDNAGAAGYSDVDALQHVIQDLLREVCEANGIPVQPLAGIVKAGDSVLVKPNWVIHENFSGKGLECLVTHPNFILAVLKEVFRCSPAKVVVGDAPIQGCLFDTLVTPQWRREVEKIATCPVEILDFRRTILKEGGLSEGQVEGTRSADDYVLFDLGHDSLLDPVSYTGSRFRITCYNPDILAERHRKGRHQYLLCKEPFESDVIINLPKVKTHKKAGLTGALKNLVGINGNKEYLPHHRIGSPLERGDCYRTFSPLKKIAEICLDEANRNIGTQSCTTWMNRFSGVMQLRSRFGDTEIEGGWYGNDTVWRMTLDLNRLALYGRPDAAISDTQLRRVFSIADGIVAGEAEGPLAPHPVNLGLCTFAASSAFADLVHAYLMGFDYRKIPAIREAFGSFRYPLVSSRPERCKVRYNGSLYSPEEAARILGQRFEPAKGWKGRIERQPQERGN